MRSQDYGLRTYYVNCRLKQDRADGDWLMEWRTVIAKSFEESMLLVSEQPDVQWVYESSLIPGGVVT